MPSQCNEQAVLCHRFKTHSVTLGTSKINKCASTFHHRRSLNRHQASLPQTAFRVDIGLLAYIIMPDYPVISIQRKVPLRDRTQGDIQASDIQVVQQLSLSTFTHRKRQDFEGRWMCLV